MAKAKQTAPPQDDAKLQALATALAGITESIQEMNKRLSKAEEELSRVIPRETLVPAQVWLSLEKEAVLAATIKGCVEGILSNAPLHNLGSKNMQETYAKLALEMADTFLVEFALKGNQKVVTNEQDS